jgi:VWFA-related protein
MGSAVRRLLVGVALALIPVVLLAQQPTFKAGTQIVPLYVTVQDIEKRLVPDLVKEDFDVLDNGVPVTLTLFQNEPEPFSVVVMLDTSGSMTLTIDLLQEAAEQFVIRLMPADKGIVGAFNDKIQFPIADFTNSRDDLVGGIREVDYASTRLGCDRCEHRTAQARERPPRRAGVHRWGRYRQQDWPWQGDG